MSPAVPIAAEPDAEAIASREAAACGGSQTASKVARRYTIAEASDEADVRRVAALFRAYAAGLPIPLDYQDFAAEVVGLPGRYAGPRGRLLVARDPSGVGIGCVALRPLANERECEIKRLHVDPHHRGGGLGRALVAAAIEAARSIGYEVIRLDTLSTMVEAQRLYAAGGFTRTAPYYSPTPAGTVFMELRLADAAGDEFADGATLRRMNTAAEGKA